ncbi:nucleotidyl transferase AbiEii/AbiGii toxin family protein [Luteibacter yeojuensis]
MSVLKLRASAPLDPDSRAIIRAMTQAAADIGVRVMVVGASARDIVLGHVYDIPLRRATADVDFAVAIQGWNAFDSIVQRLLEDPRFIMPHDVAHRLYYKADTTGHSIPVDIVPFGPGVGGPKFRWPNDPDVEMNVEGYPDAARAASQVDVGGTVIDVLDTPGLALLKLFAWSDRHAATRKDASDLYTLLSHYAELGNIERMYDDPALLDDVGHDYRRGSARLLGRDVRQLCSVGTLFAVRDVLTPANVRQLALDAYAEHSDVNSPLDLFHELFDDFAADLRR